jgi:Xaa-Pro aminopeptidase
MIKESEYKQRRNTFLKQLKKKSIAILVSATPKTRSNDTEYPYRQESNFYYLSGFKEDNSVLVFIKLKKEIKTVLFVYKKDKNEELWNGKRLGVKKAKKIFKIDEIYLIDSFESVMKPYLTQVDTLYFDFLSSKDTKISFLQNSNITRYEDLQPLVGMQRLIKSEAEIGLIQKALQITKEAHHHAMKSDKREMYEYQLQAEFEYIFKKNGAYNDAYTSIVAGGDGANTLHYIKNDRRLQKGELILIDAGCEYEYYASDITRTIAVDGYFSKSQKEIYELVLSVELKIIEMIKPNIKRSSLQKKAVDLLVDGMLSLGILKGSKKKIIKKELYKPYYPHGIGHWLGIDVHDRSPYVDRKGKEILLQEGMVLTIEPGLYLGKGDKKIPKKYRGIGIRIEDNILVTKDGYINLSKDIVKSIESMQKV